MLVICRRNTQGNPSYCRKTKILDYKISLEGIAEPVEEKEKDWKARNGEQAQANTGAVVTENTG